MKFRELFNNSQIISIILIIVGIAFLIPIPGAAGRLFPKIVDDFFIKISPELIGIGLGVFLIGRANDRRAEIQERENLTNTEFCSKSEL